MSPDLSDDLIAFLKAWHDWATNGAPDKEPFNRHCGLCSNSWVHGENARISLGEALGNGDFPFGESEYCARYRDRTQHECPERLAWVRERLIEAGELVA